MTPDTRRIVAIEAHRRRTGHCPTRVYSLGTGEIFDVTPAADGFLDVATGLIVRSNGRQIKLPAGSVDLDLVGDVFFEGRDQTSGEPFTGRAGGGASVTLYGSDGDDYFQYAMVTEDTVP